MVDVGVIHDEDEGDNNNVYYGQGGLIRGNKIAQTPIRPTQSSSRNTNSSKRDREENVGAKLIQEVAAKSDSKAGDGTTTSTIMTQALVNQGMRAVTSGVSPVALNRGIRKAARIIADEITAIATVSSI